MQDTPTGKFAERVLPRMLALNAPDMFSWKKYGV